MRRRSLLPRSIRQWAKKCARRVLPPAARRRIRDIQADLRRGRTTSPAEPGRRIASDEVAQLEDQLWLGYRTASVSGLMALRQGANNPESVRADAASALGRWSMARGEYAEGLDYLLQALALSGDPAPADVALVADCYCLLGDGRQAIQALTSMSTGAMSLPSNLLRLGHARSILWQDDGHGSGPMLEAINRLYLADGYVGVNRRNVFVPVDIDNLCSVARPYDDVKSSTLVSVVMPAYNASKTIMTALMSLTNQSWPDLEIIVVDDCSTDQTRDVVASASEVDSRIRLLTSSRNIGAYGCRNIGLSEARGELVTVHDADDWSHPQKVEAQAVPLVVDERLSATGSYCVRAGLGLMPFQLEGRPSLDLIGQNASSLMFRRSIFDRIGCWDHVRTAADNEFRQRLQAWAGVDSIRWVSATLPLSIARRSNTSLTASGPLGFESRFHALGARGQYRAAYQWWHASPEFRDALPYVPPQAVRPFPVPDIMIDGRDIYRKMLDTTFVADFSQNDDFTEAVLLWVSQHNLDGIGLVHVPSFRAHGRRPSDAFRALAAEGRVLMIGRDSVVECRQLVIGPSMLRLPLIDDLPKVNAGEVILVESAESGAGSSDGGTELLRAWTSLTVRVVNSIIHGSGGAVPWE